MPSRDRGEYSRNLMLHKEVMPYNVYTYENVNMGACSIQSALYILKDDDKQHYFR